MVSITPEELKNLQLETPKEALKNASYYMSASALIAIYKMSSDCDFIIKDKGIEKINVDKLPENIKYTGNGCFYVKSLDK